MLGGEADGRTITELKEVAALHESEQLAALSAAILKNPARHPIRPRPGSLPRPQEPLRLRGVLGFNPVQFLRKRAVELEKLQAIRERVEAINRRRAQPDGKRTDASVLAEIAAMVRRAKLGDVLFPHLEGTGSRRPVVIDQDDGAWDRRRRCDGVTLLVGHAELVGSAADIFALYASKDAVEKDFQTIKSLVERRPVRHRTDPELHAHVTLCMLALVLERNLAARLAAANAGLSAPAAIERLATTHLNRVRHGTRRFYTVTTPTDDARAVLTALGMADVANNENVRDALTPR